MSSHTYYTPRGIIAGPSAPAAVAEGRAWPFLGWGGFTTLELTQARDKSVIRAFLSLSDTAALAKDMRATLANFGTSRPVFAGLDLGQPRLMGVVNVTPDSFSDGGAHATKEAAIAHGIALLEGGADIIDVGGESTRPGATPVDAAEDSRRVLPVIQALATRGACVSIDTRHAVVMEAAIDCGARIVNDVTALTDDPAALGVVARSRASVVLMHMQGNPRTMQENPTYAWAPGDVYDWLSYRVAACVEAGIGRDRIAIDPGIGFGKTPSHSVEILNHLGMYHGLGCAVALGASRKRFISSLSRGEGADKRLAGSLAAALHGVAEGVQIIRVHDVAETRQALTVAGRLAGRG
jgi:dihydropteroate synthase